MRFYRSVLPEIRQGPRSPFECPRPRAHATVELAAAVGEQLSNTGQPILLAPGAAAAKPGSVPFTLVTRVRIPLGTPVFQLFQLCFNSVESKRKRPSCPEHGGNDAFLLSQGGLLIPRLPIHGTGW